MIITAIEPIPLRIPFKAGNTSDASAWGDSNLPAADALFVKVTTDHGLIGWGEAFGFRAVGSAKLAIDQLVAPLCIGQNATRIEALMLDVQKKLHVFGRGGALAFAISAVDIALWDIAGKAANNPPAPLHEDKWPPYGPPDQPHMARLWRLAAGDGWRRIAKLAVSDAVGYDPACTPGRRRDATLAPRVRGSATARCR
jgi:hypothetical protein